jgi:hypothetical protein
MPKLHKILQEAYRDIQEKYPQKSQPEYIKSHFSECVVEFE